MACEMDPQELSDARRFLEWALEEDHAHDDCTSRLTIPPAAGATVELRNRQPGVPAGIEALALGFEIYGSDVEVETLAQDGEYLEQGQCLARMSGARRDLLAVERSVLNLLGMLGATATLTRRFVRAAGDRCRVLDTRKTLPGARRLQKYAVRCGGGHNHRMHLGDGFLLKDNHRHEGIEWAELVRRAREENPRNSIVIEVDSLEQFDEVLPLGPDRVLLDNFDLDEIREARRRRDAADSKVGLEVSGRVTLDRVAAIAAAGADCVSVGALTHSAPVWDLGFDLVESTEP